MFMQSARRLKGDLEIKVIGVVNSKKMLWADNDTGLDLLQWKNKLHLQVSMAKIRHLILEIGTLRLHRTNPILNLC